MDERLTRWSGRLRNPRVLGVLVAFLAIIAITLPLFGYIRYDSALDDVESARWVRQQVDEALFAAVNAETGLRGYVISGNPEFLEPYDSGREAFRTHIRRARSLAGDDSAMLERLDTLEALLERWVDEAAARQVSLVESGDLVRAQSVAASGGGREVIDELRREANKAVNYLRAREAELRETQRQAGLLALALAAGGIVSVVGVGGLVSATVVSRARERLHHATTVEALQAERAVSQQRSEMLSAASHDLRNPLGAIVMAADALAEGAAQSGDSDLAELAQNVKDGAHRTAMLAADLLDFTRAEAGRLVIEQGPVDPLNVVSEAIADLRLWRPGQPVDVDPQIEPGASVVGDARRLRAAVRNLLENACLYARPPYRVRVLRGGDLLEIHVEDAGPGVPLEDRERIFDRFERGATGGSREGTGIGLFVCRGIAERHGGHLTVGASVLGGADFVLRLPARPHGGSPAT